MRFDVLMCFTCFSDFVALNSFTPLPSVVALLTLAIWERTCRRECLPFTAFTFVSDFTSALTSDLAGVLTSALAGAFVGCVATAAGADGVVAADAGVFDMSSAKAGAVRRVAAS